MNKFTTTLVLALSTAAGGALADDITIDTTPFVPTLTRAQVKAEVIQARANGGLRDWLYEHSTWLPAAAEPVYAKAEPLPTPNERHADYALRMLGEDSGSFYLSRIDLPQHRDRPVFATLTRPLH